MLRRLFTVLSALSLLLCVAVCVLWVRSYRVRTAVQFTRDDRLWEVTSDRGRLWLHNAPQCRRELDRATRERERVFAECYRLNEEARKLRRRLRLATAEQRPSVEAELARVMALGQVNGRERVAHMSAPASTTPPLARSAPHSLAVAATALPAALSATLVARPWLRRRRRQKNRLCTSCGYDLRATPERCPE